MFPDLSQMYTHTSAYLSAFFMLPVHRIAQAFDLDPWALPQTRDTEF